MSTTSTAASDAASSRGDIDVEEDAVALPEGVAKEVVRRGHGSGRPSPGDEVVLRVAGRERRVVLAPDERLLTSMVLGEIARFGEDDAVELVAWGRRRDVFGDGSFVAFVFDGGARGWRKPEVGQDVLVDVAVGDEPARRLELTLGGAQGRDGRSVLDAALLGALRGEELRLPAAPAASGLWSEGSDVSVRLLEILEEVDCSLTRDGSATKRRLEEGDGWEAPRHGAVVRLALGEEELRFAVGEGDVCDALEGAALQLRVGELADVRAVAGAWAAGLRPEAALTVARRLQSEAGRLRLRVQLLSLENPKEEDEEREALARARKTRASELFRVGRFALALAGYKAASALLRDGGAEELRLQCRLNEAACHLRLGRHGDAADAAEEVLRTQPSNFKALLRAAAAALALREHERALALLRRAIRTEPDSAEARVLFRAAREGVAAEEARRRQLYCRMMGAVGGA